MGKRFERLSRVAVFATAVVVAALASTAPAAAIEGPLAIALALSIGGLVALAITPCHDLRSPRPRSGTSHPVAGG